MTAGKAATADAVTAEAVTVRGVRIAYETAGDPRNPAVMLVHGFASNRSANWVRARWTGPLTDAGFFVIAPDLRGHGESDRPRRLSEYALARFRGDLLAVLDDQGAGAAHLIGYSLGARLVWDLALRHPDRVRSLVLGAPAVTGSFAGFDLAAARAALGAGAPRGVGGEGAGASGVAGAGAGVGGGASGVDRGGEVDAVTARYVAMMRGVAGNDPHALARLAEAQRRAGFRPRAAIPRQPMLFAAGTEDPLAPAVEELAAELPHASFVALPGRNHVTAVTSREFKAAVVEFLTALD